MYEKPPRHSSEKASPQTLWKVAIRFILEGNVQIVNSSLPDADARSEVIGLSIEEAMIFWRKGFSGITDDKFNKEYKYNIRHSYGLEGKRTNYSAFR